MKLKPNNRIKPKTRIIINIAIAVNIINTINSPGVSGILVIYIFTGI